MLLILYLHMLGISLLFQGYTNATPLDRRAVAAVPGKVIFRGKEMKAIVAFGDSYSYVGGTYGRSEYSWLGDAYKRTWTQNELLRNKILKNTTSAGGPNWLNYLTRCYSGYPANCNIQLWDFAFSGAAVTSEFIKPAYDFTLPLVDQTDSFLKSAHPVLKLSRSTTLVTFFIGLNDINSSYKLSRDFNVFYGNIINRLFRSVQKMYDAGYRNFLFMNAPLRYDAQSTHTAIWNTILERERWNFNNRRRDAVTFRFDTAYEFRKILRNPGSYGIKNTSGYCKSYKQPDISWNYARYGCLPMDQYFWNYNGHISYKTHKIISDDLRAAIASF
ncbi:hypothetical protein ABW19_dt0203020 [Dactylella cylindrospora]|nr:hypothetical protein ABW19_dt0203020 [Dactylella cylindrospora]